MSPFTYKTAHINNWNDEQARALGIRLTIHTHSGPSQNVMGSAYTSIFVPVRWANNTHLSYEIYILIR